MRHAAPPVTSTPFTNWRLYRARRIPRTYLVISTYFDGEKQPEVPDPDAFEEAHAIQALLADLERAQWKRPRGASPEAPPRRRRAPITLRTHGYNTRFEDFVKDLLGEASAPPAESFRPGRRVLIGYRWPSEGVFSGSSLRDTWRAVTFTAPVGLGLLLLPLLALVPQVHRWLAGGESGPAAALVRPFLWPYASLSLATLLLGAGLLMLAQRLSTYLRDRYRALHYGVPDLCEFVSDLEVSLVAMEIRVAFDMVGHSMGCLVLVNAVRVLSDFFHAPGDVGRTLGRRGAIELRTLVLAAPDIPAALASPARNNYFLSALRRFAAVHVLSSDRDIVLKWGSTLVNWASEPRHDMAGRHLGNVLLAAQERVPGPLRAARRVGVFVPLLRPQVRDFPVLDPTLPALSSPRTAWVGLHDCTRCPSLAGVGGPPVWLSLALAAGALALAWALPRPFTMWLAAVTTLFLGLGAALRGWRGWRDRWRLGPWAGMLADMPSVAGFWKRMNPHGGYFVPGSEPRRLISSLLAASPRPLEPGQAPALVHGSGRIRTCAIALPV